LNFHWSKHWFPTVEESRLVIGKCKSEFKVNPWHREASGYQVEGSWESTEQTIARDNSPARGWRKANSRSLYKAIRLPLPLLEQQVQQDEYILGCNIE
jgi:hypothetical protein